MFKEIFLTDFYAIDSWAGKLPPGAVIVDVGANAGFFGMLLLSRRPDVVMYAYEPILKNFEVYGSNLKKNPAKANQVKLFQLAVTGKPMPEVILYKESDSDNSVTASVYTDFEKHNLNTVSVGAISLEEILRKHQLEKVDLLKLDCEGSEYPIVYDSPQSIWPRIQSIFLEVHNLDKDKRNFEALSAFLHQQGYQTTSSVAENGCYAVHAVRK